MVLRQCDCEVYVERAKKIPHIHDKYLCVTELPSQGWRFLPKDGDFHTFLPLSSCPRAAAVIAFLACQVAEIPAILPPNAVSKILVEKCKFPKVAGKWMHFFRIIVWFCYFSS
jgi:hypothetical protein